MRNRPPPAKPRGPAGTPYRPRRPLPPNTSRDFAPRDATQNRLQAASETAHHSAGTAPASARRKNWRKQGRPCRCQTATECRAGRSGGSGRSKSVVSSPANLTRRREQPPRHPPPTHIVPRDASQPPTNSPAALERGSAGITRAIHSYRSRLAWCSRGTSVGRSMQETADTSSRGPFGCASTQVNKEAAKVRCLQ